MSATYRVGVIASGRIAREHGRGWAECEHTEIVAIADAHPEALSATPATLTSRPNISTTERCSTKKTSTSSACARGIRSTPR